MGNLLRIESGKGLTAKNMKEGNIPVYGGNGVTGYHSQSLVSKGTVVIGRVGFYCGSVHVTDSDAWVTDNAFIVQYPTKYVFRDYLIYTLKFMDLGKNNNATAQPVVSGKKIYPKLFPLPPIEEQKRIANRISEIEPYIENYQHLYENIKLINDSIKEKLKKSILQYAIQGKLVEQNPDDEPASELIKRIRAEKEKLIKSGKLKKDKNESFIYRGSDNSYYEKFQNDKEVCIDDEIPFEIPQSWEWCRLSNVCKLIDGQKVNISSLPIMDAKFLRGKPNVNYANNGKFAAKGTYLILVDGENSGEVFIAPNDGYMGSTFKILWISSEVNSSYILNFIELYRIPLKNSKRGVAIPHLNKELFFNLFIPVPPLNEQERIVNKVSLLQLLLQ